LTTAKNCWISML